ncbi:MAG: hypothetical protein BWX72_01857 [Firmicutes bacterium ADurb.Bin080]|jgi:uncharacterized protein|nr:PTS sugar transporter subunit IIC [Clostridiales bacterium]OQC12786.1 MAG: hypothetical protein BWX72_01857 [Firmicutes bacterium ADurb.Bin080]
MKKKGTETNFIQDQKPDSTESQEVGLIDHNNHPKKFLLIVKKYANRWFIQAFSGMAQGLFVTLIAGTIIKQLGKLIQSTGTPAGISIGNGLNVIGSMASILMGAGIGAGIAKYLKCSNLTVLSCTVAGLIGAFSLSFIEGTWVNLATQTISIKSPGNPVGSYVCALIAAEVGNLVSGKTKLDILLVPLTVIFVSALSTFVAWPFIKFIDLIAKGIEISVAATPFFMGIVISTTMGLLLTLPTSSAAIWISIAAVSPNSDAMLIAGGAACVGCCAHMVGFAVSSFRENRWGGLIAQGLGTSMLQIPNLIKNPKILIPQIVASMIVGPLSTTVFMLRCNASGGGMGTSGFVGILGMIEASSGLIPVWQLTLGILLLAIVIPAIISFGVSELLRKVNWIKVNDMKLEI